MMGSEKTAVVHFGVEFLRIFLCTTVTGYLVNNAHFILFFCYGFRISNDTSFANPAMIIPCLRDRSGHGTKGVARSGFKTPDQVQGSRFVQRGDGVLKSVLISSPVFKEVSKATVKGMGIPARIK